MVISDIRRRLLKKKENNSYVTDGLIFWLDAEDYNGGNTILARVPNVEGTCQNRSKQNGGIYASAYKNTIIKIPNTLGNIDISNCTVECCVKKTATGNTRSMNLVFSIGNKPALTPFIGFHAGDNQIRFNTADNYTSNIRCASGSQYLTNGKYIISCNYDNLIINSQAKAISRAPYNAGQSGANDGYIWIGNGWPTDSTGYGFVGYIYSVRLYNRKLTTDEMLHNQSVDEQRFGAFLN